MTATPAPVPLDRNALARRVADDIPEGWIVNLGIGIPTLVPEHIPPAREVILQSENGVIGMGPAPPPGREDPYLINANKQMVTLVTGGSYVHHAASFAMIRGRHLDLCVLGGFEVSERGDLANWKTLDAALVPAVGGAMDLAIGAARVWVAMQHVTKEGTPRLVRRCSYPLTAPGVVTRVYTDLAVLDVTPEGFRVTEMIPGLSFESLQARTDAKLLPA